ncbi:keratin, type I cytoskeletal 9-like [Asparagus officinalis]|uniref:keratin, type I cytoskeletal 9-like n=1 Tax=Asparagus officinalis TaxID=4686 RepID=UPI00098DE815|nr:keratin, type I cytoskeletal 9-like [Asparagus officinalis]
MTNLEKMTTNVGSLSLQYPMLSRDNYASWAIKMKVYMKAQDVWDAIEPAAGASVEHRKDQMALAAIYQGIPEETLMVIAEKQTAKEAWETLKTMHLGADRVRNAKVQTLKSEFELLRMKENDNVDDFSTKLTGVVNKIRALGGEMEENYVVRKLLRAVPERFLTIVSTIEQFGDIDNMTLEEAIGRLKAHEERARVFRNNGDDHLLLTHAEWQERGKKSNGNTFSTQASSDGNGRGRARGAGRGRGRGQAGRGGQFGRGRGQGGRGGEHGGQAGRGGFGGRGGRPGGGFGHGGAARQEGESSTSGGRDKSNIKCFNCGVYGHFQSECHKQRRNNEQEAHLTRA